MFSEAVLQGRMGELVIVMKTLSRIIMKYLGLQQKEVPFQIYKKEEIKKFIAPEGPLRNLEEMMEAKLESALTHVGSGLEFKLEQAYEHIEKLEHQLRERWWYRLKIKLKKFWKKVKEKFSELKLKIGRIKNDNSDNISKGRF